MIIDFHTHIFPDFLAERAIETLCSVSEDLYAHHNGTLNGLLASMNGAGIDKAVIASIATKPEQFEPILEWSKNINSERIIPFASVHPHDRNIKKHVKMIVDAGIKGVKMHPYYQDFILNDEKLFFLYDLFQKYGLIFLSHTGFDIAYEPRRICDPERILRLHEKFPALKFVASHCGAWNDWDNVERFLLGKKIYMEISFASQMINHDKLLFILKRHPAEYLLFGTDSPWTDQNESVSCLKALPIPAELKEKIFFKNAENLLKS